jgi:hypothetical protein
LGQYSVTQFLVSRGIGDIRAKNTEGKGYGAALNAACNVYPEASRSTRHIIDAGADVNAIAGKDWLPLNQLR